MRLKEQKLWDRMRRNLQGLVHMERVENVMVDGMPDVLCLAEGNVVMCELKAVEGYPARETTRVLGQAGLSRAQMNWHMAWRRWGGHSLIVVGVGRDLYALEGSHGDYVNNYTKAQLFAHSVARDWDGVIRYMRNAR